MSTFIAVSLITAGFCIRGHLLLIDGCKFQLQISTVTVELKWSQQKQENYPWNWYWSHLSRTGLLGQWYGINSLKLVCNKRVWSGWVPVINWSFLRSSPFLVPDFMTTLPSMARDLYWCMRNSPAICMLVPSSFSVRASQGHLFRK